jgi:hypothetical protein
MTSTLRPRLHPRLPAMVGVGAVLFASAIGCRDVTRYSTRGDHYEGDVVRGSFVRAGLAEDAKMCVTLDAEHLQDKPGTLTTSDGRFRATPLRPIPQLWHDPLSSLAFGDGRRQNVIYAATPAAPASPASPAGDVHDVMVVLSLMDEGGIEVRLLRGAPGEDASAPSASPPLFGIFTLDRREGSCSF